MPIMDICYLKIRLGEKITVLPEKPAQKPCILSNLPAGLIKPVYVTFYIGYPFSDASIAKKKNMSASEINGLYI
jgi:hypothetical protein